MKPQYYIIALMTLQFACSKESPSEPVLDLSEDRGIALTEKDERVTSLSSSEFVWSPDGQEIFYMSSPQISSSSRLRAVRVMDKSRRTVIEGNMISHWFHGLSPDGKYFYYAASPSSGDPALFRVATNGQNAELLIRNVSIYGTGPAVALSPDNNSIAYTALHDEIDSLFIFDAANKSKKFYVIGLPVVFSPDGSQLLFKKRFNQLDSLYLVALDNRSIQPLVTIDYTIILNSWMTRWDNHGVRILLSSGEGNFIRNITTGTTTTVLSGSLASGFAWSPEGNKFANRAERCLQARSVLECGITEYSINVLDLGSNQTRRVAYGNDADAGDYALSIMAFSPDARRIAFVLGSQIYLKDI
jgi:Tol biopolymer transport system component